MRTYLVTYLLEYRCRQRNISILQLYSALLLVLVLLFCFILYCCCPGITRYQVSYDYILLLWLLNTQLLLCELQQYYDVVLIPGIAVVAVAFDRPVSSGILQTHPHRAASVLITCPAATTDISR